MDRQRRDCLKLISVPVLGALGACASSGPPPLTELGSLIKNQARMVWEEDFGEAGVGFAPVVSDSSIWVANQAGEVVSVDALSGETLREFDAGRPLAAGPAVDGSSVVVVDTDGVMHAFDETGKTLWFVDLGAEPLTIPVIQSGQVILRLSNSTVVSYDVADGKRRWLFAQQNPALVLRQNAAIAVDLSSAYVGMASGRIVALSLSTGASRWEARISVPRGANEIERITDVIGMPSVSGSNICAAAYQGRLTCLDSSDGATVWSQDIKAGSGVAVDARQVVVADISGRVHAYTRSQLALWEQDGLRGRRLASPAMIDGKIWIGDAGGVVHVLDAQDGRVIGRVETDGSQIVSVPSPVYLQDKLHVIVQTSDGMLAALAA